MDKRKSHLLFLDSGMGGLSIAGEFQKLYPAYGFLYFADTLNFPYGEKTEEELKGIVLKILDSLFEEYNISMIILACNTLSVSVLSFLRTKFTIPIIGTVPPVKVAAENTSNNNIGVIATDTTVKLEYLNNLINKFALDKNVFVKPAQQLVDAIENDITGKELEKIMQSELGIFKEKDIDYLVLGCTHYFLISDQLESFFDNRVKLANSVYGVIKRIIYLMDEFEITNLSIEKNLLLSSDATLNIYKKRNEKYHIFDKIIIKDSI